MSQDEILSSVEEKLSHIDGLKAYRRLERETKDKVIVLEREAEESSIKNGLLRVANLGIFNALERQISMVLIFEAGSRLLDRAENLIQLKDQKGQLVGEWVNPEKARAMQGDKSVSFLSHDFVLYENCRDRWRTTFRDVRHRFPFPRWDQGHCERYLWKPIGRDRFVP